MLFQTCFSVWKITAWTLKVFTCVAAEYDIHSRERVAQLKAFCFSQMFRICSEFSNKNAVFQELLSLYSHIMRLVSIVLRNLVWPPDAIIALMASAMRLNMWSYCGIQQIIKIYRWIRIYKSQQIASKTLGFLKHETEIHSKPVLSIASLLRKPALSKTDENISYR